MIKRRRNTHYRPISAWVAILAMMIDALLPTTVSAAAAASGAPGPIIAICGGAGSVPGKHEVPLPIRHCALCSGLVFNLTPSRQGYLTIRRTIGLARLPVQSCAPRAQRPIRNDVQPRAPPELA